MKVVDVVDEINNAVQYLIKSVLEHYKIAMYFMSHLM